MIDPDVTPVTRIAGTICYASFAILSPWREDTRRSRPMADGPGFVGPYRQPNPKSIRELTMIQINIGDHSGNENGIPFTPIPADRRGQVRWARTKAFWIARNLPGANIYFRSLSSGRSLTNLLDDGTIWINFDPTLTVDGATFHNNDLWVGPRPFRIGRWTVLATIIHELAHIGGAGGAATGLTCSAFSVACHAAERAVLECGMGKRSEARTGVDDPATPYNPTILG